MIDLNTLFRPCRWRFAKCASTLLLAGLLALPLLAGGCRRAPEGAPVSDSTIVIGSNVDMVSINELITRNTALHTGLHYYLLYMPLLEEQPGYTEGPVSWKPRLAVSWRRSADGRQLTFELRPDAVWSDGVPITAEDVRWTWQAQTDPEVAWPVASAKGRIRDVEVVDDHTVRYHFDEPYAGQLFDVAGTGVILPKHAWSRLPFSQWRSSARWFLEPENRVVSGPFVLERWEPQQRIVLRRNERYFADDMPSYERLVIRIVPDESALVSQLRRGDLNLIEAEAPSAIRLMKDPEIEVESYANRQNVYIAWNLLRPPFDDRRVRQALTMAIDRREIIDTLYRGYALLPASWYDVESWVYHPDLEPRPYDPERARALLAEAGFHDRDGDGVLDRDGKPFRFELLTNADNQVRIDILVMVQDQLRRVGIAVDTKLIEFNTLIGREQAHDFDASLTSLSIDTSFDLTSIFHSESAEGYFNWGSYSNPEVDRLIFEIRDADDPRSVLPLYHQVQELLHQDQPVTLLYQPLRFVAYRGIENVRPNALSLFLNIRAWRLVENEE